MLIYFLIYIIIIGLFQLLQYRRWKNGKEEKKVFAYLYLGRVYLLLLFLPIVYRPPVPSLVKFFYTFFLLIGFIINILLRSYFFKGCKNLRSSLRPDSKIIITGVIGIDRPWNSYFKFLSLFSILISAFIKSPLVVRQGNYLIISDILALAFADMIAPYQTYIYLYHSIIPSFLKRESDRETWEAELYLICQDKSKNLSEKPLPFPADKIRYVDENDFLSFPHCLVHIIENDPGIRGKIEYNLSSYQAYQGTDPGKLYLAQLICQLLEKRRSVTEYFYELMKLAEFMIHYRGLADYEKGSKSYFDSGEPIAMGTFQEGIVDSAPCDLPEQEAYIQALKYLNQLCTGKEGSVNRKKLMREGRQKLVMVRNHYIGHGSLSYGISADFVQYLLVVVAAQTADFFRMPEPVMQQPYIHEVPKIRRQEDGLYLLVQLERGSAFYYLDHGSGKFLTDMQ